MRTFLFFILIATAGLSSATEVMETAPVLMAVQAPPSASGAQDIFGDINGVLVRETPHFQIYVEKSFLPVDLEWLQAEIESIHTYLSERMGVRANEKFAVTFRAPDTRPCPIRGLARGGSAVAEAIVFADDQTSRIHVLGVLAHEIGHLFHFRALKAGHDNTYLTEGLATWAAGKYWEKWKDASLAQLVRSFQSEGRYRPLIDYYREDMAASLPSIESVSCLNERDLRYTSWAAFVDFLINNYGMEKFRQLLGPAKDPTRMEVRTGNRASVIPSAGRWSFSVDDIRTLPGFGNEVFIERVVVSPTPVTPIPDFPGVYGLRLEELEKAWLDQLSQSTP